MIKNGIFDLRSDTYFDGLVVSLNESFADRAVAITDEEILASSARVNYEKIRMSLYIKSVKEGMVPLSCQKNIKNQKRKSLLFHKEIIQVFTNLFPISKFFSTFVQKKSVNKMDRLLMKYAVCYMLQALGWSGIIFGVALFLTIFLAHK